MEISVELNFKLVKLKEDELNSCSRCYFSKKFISSCFDTGIKFGGLDPEQVCVKTHYFVKSS